MAFTSANGYCYIGKSTIWDVICYTLYENDLHFRNFPVFRIVLN